MLAPSIDDPRRRQGLKDMRAHPENWGRNTRQNSARISARPHGHGAGNPGMKSKSRTKTDPAAEGKIE